MCALSRTTRDIFCILIWMGNYCLLGLRVLRCSLLCRPVPAIVPEVLLQSLIYLVHDLFLSSVEQFQSCWNFCNDLLHCTVQSLHALHD